ncbi:uncharacterized protein LOC133886270 [Phragmites australis]|uniref:uncharacterized protein LOC133886270 n=1 Tax=Phragmites australis TaxID=29695 RepID=UPI002D7820DC|nr:uncharacterized protein LOC133886270 [Phragmites australis]
MALRALDNTLPAAVEERPKKVPKLAAAPVPAVQAASPGSGKKKKNDENSAPRATAAAGEQAVEYIPSEELEAATNPKAKAAGLVAELDSKDWVRTCEALNDTRRLAIHHSALLNPILVKVMLAIVKTMKNPRSAVLKTSIMACTDIFYSLGNLLSSASDEAFDKLLLQLLLKASQDKRFVCEEAEKAMRAMAASMPPLPLLKKLKAYVHHANLRVRAKAAVAISHCASRMDIEAMKEFGMSALLKVAADLLNDRLPEAREAARSVVGSMHSAFAKEAAAREEDGPAVAASWESLCSLSLPPMSAQAVAKIASSQLIASRDQNPRLLYPSTSASRSIRLPLLAQLNGGRAVGSMDGSKNVERPHGAAAEEDPGRHGAPVVDEADGDEKAPRRSRRVTSLDVFRGLTVALMILVDGAGGEWPVIGHAPWNGCNLADFVMPFFLFIVGMAIPLSLKRIPDRGRAVRRVVIRTLKLLFWGILLQGGYSHAPDELTYGVDMKHVRWGGILQRIALAYLVVAILEIVTKDAKVQDQSSSGFSIFRMYFSQWIVACCILVIYLSLVYGIYVPDWEFRVRNVDSPNYGKVLTVTCGTRGKLNPPCNVVGYIDRKVLGINHMYQKPAWRRHRACTDASPHEGPFKNDAPAWCVAPFEPEGILSSLSAVLSTIIGVHYGHVLVHMKSHRNRLKQWITMGISLVVLGIILHFSHAIPLNKQLYTFSYICVTAGAAGVVFSMLYFLVDILNLRYLFAPLQWIGMNAMLVYVMAAEGIFEGFLNGWYYDGTNNTLVYWVRKHVFVRVWHSTRVGILLYVLFAQILFWALVSGLLHRAGLYWKL